MKRMLIGILVVVLLMGCSQTEVTITPAEHDDTNADGHHEDDEDADHADEVVADPVETAPVEPVVDTPVEVEAEDTTPPAPPYVVKSFTMEAKQFEFIPDTITVQEGDHVELKVTSTDVSHGIAISAFGVRESLPPNKEVTIEFVADKKGSFNFFCSVPCGSGHRGMTGTLIVE
jgi:cytochrome c oxidase subunit 2